MTASSDALLEHAASVSHFGGFKALDDASVRLPRSYHRHHRSQRSRESTLFNVLAGSEKAGSGDVFLDGAAITRQPVHWRARHGLTRTFQISRELGSLTVLENLLLAVPHQPGGTALGARCSAGKPCGGRRKRR